MWKINVEKGQILVSIIRIKFRSVYYLNSRVHVSKHDTHDLFVFLILATAVVKMLNHIESIL